MNTLRGKALSTAMAVVFMLGLCPVVALASEGEVAKPQAEDTQVQRLYGETAAETAAKIAAEVTSQSDYVVVARDDDYADALGSVGLAGVQKAPIVLTDRFTLSDAARSSLASCGAKMVYLIGGTGAVKQEVEDAIVAMGIQVVRVFGTDASDTSIACAEKIAQIKQERGEATDKAVVAMSDGFQDALSASSYAYYYGTPVILLSSSDNAADRVLKDEAVQLLSGSGAYTNANILAPGGTGAMPAASVEGVLGEGRVTRVFGETGYDTSNQLAWYFTENNLLSAETVCVACGAADPKGVDALAGSALAGSRGGVIVLATSNPAVGAADTVTLNGIDSKGKSAFLASNATAVTTTYVLGGSFVLPSDIFNEAADLTGASMHEVDGEVVVDPEPSPEPEPTPDPEPEPSPDPEPEPTPDLEPDPSPDVTPVNPETDFEYVIADGSEGYEEGEYINDLISYYYGPGAYVKDYVGESKEVVVPATLGGASVVSLDCRGSSLTSLDVSDCTSLTDLNCRANSLTLLDVGHNATLTILDCSWNNLTSLDVSNNTALTDLDCHDNNLMSLDVSGCTALAKLECYDGENHDNNLTSLDVSDCTALTSLSCSDNGLTSLDVSHNVALTHLACTSNSLTSLNVNRNMALTELYCSYNNLTSLDMSSNTALTYLSCSNNNNLTSLDVSRNMALTELRCSYNNLTSLDVSHNTTLTDLVCHGNNLTSLDVSCNTALTNLYCYDNNLTSLDVSSCAALTLLYCANNSITDTSALEAWLTQEGHFGQVNPQNV